MSRKLCLFLSMLGVVVILCTLGCAPKSQPDSKGASLEATTDDGRVVLLKPDGTWEFTGGKRSIPSSSAQSDSPPSQAEVQACINSSQDGSINGGPLEQLQFGTPTTSQGGMMELGMGAAKGTTMFPAKYILRTTEGSPYERSIWIFKDPFGKWTCIRS
jgi:hypothetical protein